MVKSIAAIILMQVVMGAVIYGCVEKKPTPFEAGTETSAPYGCTRGDNIDC